MWVMVAIDLHCIFVSMQLKSMASAEEWTKSKVNKMRDEGD